MDGSPWAAHWVLPLRIALAHDPNPVLREEMGPASEDESLTPKVALTPGSPQVSDPRCFLQPYRMEFLLGAVSLRGALLGFELGTVLGCLVGPAPRLVEADDALEGFAQSNLLYLQW